MKISDNVIVIARIGKGPGPVSTAGLPGARPSQPVPVGAVMNVDIQPTDTLTALTVALLDPEHKDKAILNIPGETYAEWRWLVTANQVGTWHLELKVYVHLQDQNVPVKEVPAPVVVDPVAAVTVQHARVKEVGNFWSNYWQWILGSVLTGLGVLATFLALRKPKQASKLARRRPPRRPRLGSRGG